MIRRQQHVLTLLALIFSAPLAVAWLAYHTGRWHPLHGVQHGELLPLQALSVTSLHTVDGPPFEPAQLQGHWTLLYRNGDRCGEACMQTVSILQHIRLAQGAAMAKVQRLLVLPEAPERATAQLLRNTGNDLHITTATQWPLPAGWLYLLDPQGNLVMRYPPGFAPRGVLQDLQRLLQRSGAH